ncbi:uncharacterized protein LOC124353103 [Homalodisca vitripennis]|uniref:uncharacterized protein LOC124353103 n=1 Tax=Homalodisca vitripennis TaxID=197043 RepID=UPI001EEAA84D|nr:uncharacterized protein LOC124353103 [Homalodisca vitripennis]
MAVLNLVTLDWLFTAALFVVTVILVKIHASVRRKKEIMGDMPCYPGYLPLLGHAHLATQFTYTGFIDEIRRTRKDNKGTLHIWVGPKLCAFVANHVNYAQVSSTRYGGHARITKGLFTSG